MTIDKKATTTGLALLTLAVSGFALTAAVQAQQTATYEQALRETGIMRNIFEAAMNNDGKRGRFNMGPPESLYLAGQGMVFTFHLNGSNMYVGPNFDLGQISTALQAIQAAPPFSSGNGDFDYDYDFDFDFDYDFDGGDPVAREQQQAYQQQLQDMNQELREKQNELRDAQREIRDLQREERNDEDSDNSAEIERLSTRIDTMREELQAEAARMQQLQQEYQTERLAAFEAVRSEQTALIFSTLCDYGNTLRSLASGEHVSVVLQNYADGQTQVNVFDYADLSSCSAPDTLRQAATTYIQDSRGF